jgi:hypothetical protein
MTSARPQAPFHVLVVSRKHIRSIHDIKDEDRPVVAELIYTPQKLAEEKGDPPIRVEAGLQCEARLRPVHFPPQSPPDWWVANAIKIFKISLDSKLYAMYIQ